MGGVSTFLFYVVIVIAMLSFFMKKKGCENCDCIKCTGSKREKENGKYIVYGTKSCGYTVKLLDEIDEHDDKGEFIYKDITVKANNAEYSELGVKGVPITVSISDMTKIVVGYKPFIQLKAALK
jgi:thioredoxin-related protein